MAFAIYIVHGKVNLMCARVSASSGFAQVLPRFVTTGQGPGTNHFRRATVSYAE